MLSRQKQQNKAYKYHDSVSGNRRAYVSNRCENDFEPEAKASMAK